MRKNQVYLATTADDFETVVDFADTLKELCQRLGLSYSYCKHNLNNVFQVRNRGTSHIFIKRVDIDGED